METKVITISIPNIDVVREISKEISKQKTAELEELKRKSLEKGWESFSLLAKFISKEIEKQALKGSRCVQFDFADWTYDRDKLDDRIKFYFEGQFTSEMSKLLTEMFRKSGYNGYISRINQTSSRCYRSGEVYLYWN